MIQELLDSAALQSGERLRLYLEEFDLKEVVKEVCDQRPAKQWAPLPIHGRYGEGLVGSGGNPAQWKIWWAMP